ncbi:glycosyltransferase family 2 protein [Mucilaginibacter arboris]|uniref:Glycosyltransferase n=1 Tax=Mucilaginibacter arboris TaxID=2682090 RepID=A0A7K1T1J0_9SPHI|nr:glycosyltransferase family 2 protein [Mucilaginibacter arboris]MVN23446.1 glycosyltransferase [Mucilaginibacter arboris]
MPKLIVMLRVKDGIFFVDEWLENVEKLVDEIVVVDNGSTDGTYEVLKAHPKVVDIVRTEGFNEGRDKNLVYAMARKRNPDWCLWIDIDEIFEPELTRADFDRLMERKVVNKYGFRRFHFIDREYFAGSKSRLHYSSGHDRLMWRESAKGYFEDFIIDSPNVKGIKGLRINTDFRLKHLGYINKDIVDKKAEIYRAIIPEKEGTFQEMYLRNERKIKWIDKRSSLKVRKLNWLLTYLRFTTLLPRGINKAVSIIKKVLKKTHLQKTVKAK